MSASRVLQHGYSHRTVRTPGSQEWKWVVTDERDGRVVLSATLVHNKFVVDVMSHPLWPRASSHEHHDIASVQISEDLKHIAAADPVISSSDHESPIDGCHASNASVNVLNVSKRSGEASFSVWHQRFGHLNEQFLREYVAHNGRDGFVTGLLV